MMTDEALVRVIPSERQRLLQDMEFYAFIHFSVNTFTDREWGDGTEDPGIFNPVRLDAGQWARALRSAGMRGIILTCKHHDGFCLWPSRYTAHTVAASPWRGGKGDVVAEASAACREAGLRFGVYLSPWDRNQPVYGSGKPYDDFFVGQLTELLTGYGEICSVWLDGACGEGPNGRKQQYDWERYYRVIRSLQPGACIHVCGPDIRWCGNEAGRTRASEWSVVPRRLRDTEKIASLSQQTDSDAFRLRPIRAQDEDLGNREILRDETDLVWYPAEVNTSIRPGWFWHASEDGLVKPLSELIAVYEASVGGNATFLLNVPPTNEGLIHPNDALRLREMGCALRRSYTRNLLLEDASLEASPAQAGHDIRLALRDDEAYYLPARTGEPAVISVRWPRKHVLHHVVMKEQLALSQRIEHFYLEVHSETGWIRAAEGTVVGHKKIIRLPGCAADAVRIVIDDARVRPSLSFLGIYTDLDPEKDPQRDTQP